MYWWCYLWMIMMIQQHVDAIGFDIYSSFLTGLDPRAAVSLYSMVDGLWSLWYGGLKKYYE